MKKSLLLVIAVAFLAASCMNKSAFSQKYVTVTTFDYSNINYVEVFGSDSTYFDATNGIGLMWDDLVFFHKVESGLFQGGFMLSYLKAAGTDEKPAEYVPNDYKVAGTPFATRNVYAVFHQNPYSEMPKHDIQFTASAYGTCTMTQCWVNNTDAVYEAVKRSLNSGETLKLVATGYLNEKVTGTAEIMLAADTTMYNWTKFDLTKLGSVDAVDFELVCDNPAIPKYFCLDELTASINIEY